MSRPPRREGLAPAFMPRKELNGLSLADAEPRMQRTARPLSAPVATLILLLPAGGCALRHDQIAPAPIDPSAYAGANCQQLSRMHAKSQRTLILAEIAQDSYSEADRTRTFGVPTPMATMFGEGEAAQVARLKGDSLALSAQLARAGCLRDE